MKYGQDTPGNHIFIITRDHLENPHKYSVFTYLSVDFAGSATYDSRDALDGSLDLMIKAFIGAVRRACSKRDHNTYIRFDLIVIHQVPHRNFGQVIAS
ncbi:MAG: hypothetical protein QNK37_13910 [Acidobacteriota bacterium]|nr:hypothetical protein [Acidobacteriota bacterium]